MKFTMRIASAVVVALAMGGRFGRRLGHDRHVRVQRCPRLHSGHPTDTDCSGQNTSEWKLFPLELCDVEVDPADIAGCGDPNGTCEWLAYGANCAPAARGWSCEDLP